MTEVTLRALLESGAHLGHRTRFWNPKMEPYIYGSYHKIHIIDLEQTLSALRQVCEHVTNLALNRDKLLFVGTKRAACDLIREHASRVGQPYVCHRWLGGMLTNYKTIRASIRRLRTLENEREEGIFERLTKRESLMRMREQQKLENAIGGIKNMGGLPDALFVIDIKREHIAVSEATKLGIPIIAIVDTNSDPSLVQHVVPGNDDATRTLRLFISTIADAYEKGAAMIKDQAPALPEAQLKVKLESKSGGRRRSQRVQKNQEKT